ncbi:10870_t:CDS:2, partial [Gigaspora margarita]
TTFKYVYEISFEKSVVEQQDGGDPKDIAYNENDVTETKELEKVSEIMGHKINELKPKLWTVSEIKIFDAKGERKDLFFPNPRNLVNQLAFTKSGDLVMALAEPTHYICIFNLEYNEWILSNKFELSYFDDAFITVEGKLILFSNQAFQLTKWDLSTLTVQTNCMIDWCYEVCHVEVNQDSELLAVCAVYLQEGAPKKSNLYIYSLKSGINMALRDYDENRVELSDYNRIFVLSDTEYIKIMINDELVTRNFFTDSEISPKIDDKPTFTAQVLDQISGDWRPVEGESKRTIYPNFQPPEHMKKTKKNYAILHYYWGRARIRSEIKFNLGHVNENPFHLSTNLKTYANAFPDSKFQIIIINYFKELLDDYISDKYFIINYGSNLMDTFLFLKEDERIFLSQTAFVTPLADPELIFDSDIIKVSTTSHLYHFGPYNK